MAVTIAQPVDGGPVGIGFMVDVDSTFVGPLETGSFWRIEIFAPSAPETFVYRQDVQTGTNHANIILGLKPLAEQPFPWASTALVQDAPVLLTATLRSPTTALESLTIDAVWDTTSGVPYILQHILNGLATTPVPTTALLESIDDAVHMGFPGLPRLPLIDFFNGPVVMPTVRELITPDRTLEGTLERPGGPFDVNAFGLEWEVVSFPPGNGVKQGAPDRWSRRILDLQLVGTDASSNEYTRSYESYDVDHYRVTWNPLGLTRIQYWIEPGTTIRFYWLLLGI